MRPTDGRNVFLPGDVGPTVAVGIDYVKFNPGRAVIFRTRLPGNLAGIGDV